MTGGFGLLTIEVDVCGDQGLGKRLGRSSVAQ